MHPAGGWSASMVIFRAPKYNSASIRLEIAQPITLREIAIQDSCQNDKRRQNPDVGYVGYQSLMDSRQLLFR
jgi:hypothetical protein